MQPASRSRTSLPMGIVLNNTYAIEAEVANGGFGIVYKAHRQEVGLKVAIKEYFPVELAVREAVTVHPRHIECREVFNDGLRRFLAEAKQLVEFDSCPNIVSFRDFFRENGTAYMVMQFEDGMPLSRLLSAREARGRPFGETEMLGVVLPLLKGLHQVHSSGSLHRDIKPGNIIIRRTVSEESQRPVLIDFGAAKQALGQHSRSFAPYTDGYAAIEQVGDGRLGPWTDIYAIGAVMWRIVAGGDPKTNRRIPVKVESRARCIVQGRRDPLPSAREIGEGRFSNRILDAVDKCLRLSESDRFQDCGQLSEALQGADATVPGSSERSRRTRHAHSSPSRVGSTTANPTEVERTDPSPVGPVVPHTAKDRDRTRVTTPPAIVWLAPVVFLVLAVGSWPYSYFQFLRVLVCAATGFLAWHQWRLAERLSGWTVTLTGICLLFNPVLPIHMTREIWAVVDLATAVVLVIHFIALRASLKHRRT